MINDHWRITSCNYGFEKEQSSLQGFIVHWTDAIDSFSSSKLKLLNLLPVFWSGFRLMFWKRKIQKGPVELNFVLPSKFWSNLTKKSKFEWLPSTLKTEIINSYVYQRRSVGLKLVEIQDFQAKILTLLVIWQEANMFLGYDMVQNRK